LATTPETTFPVTVFAASWCPYCSRLIADLDRADLPEGTVEIVDVDAPGTESISEWIESATTATASCRRSSTPTAPTPPTRPQPM